MKKESSVIELKKSGRKPKISLEQVIKASGILQQQKREITGWTLRDVIGSGGPQYLLGLWNEYEEKEGLVSKDTEVTTEGHVLSAELEEKVSTFLMDISKQVNDFALESDQAATRISEKKARAAYETLMTTNKQLVDEQDLANRLIEEADTLNEQQLEAIKLLEDANLALSEKEQNLLLKIEQLESINAEALKELDLCKEQLHIEKIQTSELEKVEVRLKTQVEVAIEDKNQATDKLTNIQRKLAEKEFTIESLEKLLKERELEFKSKGIGEV
ncbi:DNA-binding protein [Pseudoalteromonas sp. 10-33]|uniref:DNA-binding protein n=1 Tax=Pseudoalteromonas sp. 10-33 TaxID=1761890 RepID=UPI0007321259|nr:DNA-binding protein [Pseudoalteromonas sp. 10-33]KTF19546.1 hypothetical protein ATS76_02660 [Pseudoalteromonas sp. 10-33]